MPASGVDDAAVNPNGIKTLLAKALITFFAKNNAVFSNEPRSLTRNPPDWIMLDNWIFDNLISVDELFAEALLRFSTFLLVNNSWGKLVLSLELPITFWW